MLGRCSADTVAVSVCVVLQWAAGSPSCQCQCTLMLASGLVSSRQCCQHDTAIRGSGRLVLADGMVVAINGRTGSREVVDLGCHVAAGSTVTSLLLMLVDGAGGGRRLPHGS
jgi:hypothetical protein